MRWHPLFTAILLTGSLLSLACGGGPDVLLHYDGANWSTISDVGGFRVWGTPRDDVFVLPSDAIHHGKP